MILTGVFYTIGDGLGREKRTREEKLICKLS